MKLLVQGSLTCLVKETLGYIKLSSKDQFEKNIFNSEIKSQICKHQIDHCYPIIAIQLLTQAACSTHTVESILVEITQWSQRGAETAEGPFTEEVGLAWLQQQQASLEVHINLPQLLQTPIGSSTHEHRSSHHEVIQTREASKGRRQIM